MGETEVPIGPALHVFAAGSWQLRYRHTDLVWKEEAIQVGREYTTEALPCCLSRVDSDLGRGGHPMICSQLVGEDQLGPGTWCLPCVHTTPMKQLFHDIVTVLSHTGVLHQEG